MSIALGSLAKVDAKVVELLRIIRSRFSDEHVEVVLTLIYMAPHADQHTKRMPAAAYRKGVIAGLSYDPLDGQYPECPYDARQLPNFLAGDNDPRQAWRDGSRDALRVRDIVLWPTRTIVPSLLHREFKALTPDLQKAHSLASNSHAAAVEQVVASRARLPQTSAESQSYIDGEG